MTSKVANRLPGGFGGILLGRLLSANMNITTDQSIDLIGNPQKVRFRIIVVTNASVSLTTAAGGIYPAVSKGGTAIVANSQAYSNLTAAGISLDLTLNTATTVYTNQGQIYFSLTTGQGAAATADIFVYGDVYQDN